MLNMNSSMDVVDTIQSYLIHQLESYNFTFTAVWDQNRFDVSSFLMIYFVRGGLKNSKLLYLGTVPSMLIVELMNYFLLDRDINFIRSVNS